MILSGQTIRKLCAGYAYNGEAPLIEPFSERTVVTTSNGLTLSHGLSSAGYDVRVEFDPMGATRFRVVRPGDFLLASTVERFALSNRIVGFVKDKSSWARRGLSVFNTVIEPGWSGYLTLEIANLGNETLIIPTGTSIAQVIFERLDEPAESPYAGKYNEQGRGPQGAR